MGGRETSMGGSREGFPDTAGSVLAGPNLSPAERGERLNRLCSRYWRPVYAFIRVLQRASVEDAKDLTQEFFRYVTEGDVVSKYDPARGRFRTFLKATLRNFLSNLRRGDRTQKRGGEAVILSLEGDPLGRDSFAVEKPGEDPDALFDRQWIREILSQSVDRLRALLKEEGKEIYFKVYENQDLCPPDRERPTYDETARALDLKPDDVRNHLHHARSRLQQIIIRTISEYAASPQDVEEELRELFRR